MPTKTPHAKKAVVTCCSQSHGWPSVRVSTSQNTASVNIAMQTPQRTISTASRESNAFHFRWRWRCRIRARKFAIRSPAQPPQKIGAAAVLEPQDAPARALLLDVAHELQQLDGVRAELGRELILDRCGGLHEAALVDTLDDLHAHRLQLVGRV